MVIVSVKSSFSRLPQIIGRYLKRKLSVKPIRVVLADAQQFFRRSLFDFLNSVPETHVVAKTCRGAELVCLARAKQPDVIVTDIQLPDVDGLVAIREIAQTYPVPGILVLTLVDQKRILNAAIQAGAKGYLLKSCSRPELLTAITSVACGQVVLDANLVEWLTGLTAPQPPVGRPHINGPMAQLTRREWEVLMLMGQGLNNCEIAARLCLSPKTIRNYASHIFAKLQVKNRSQAILAFHQMRK
jgi:DNA-binding NarL/FixJ family response regulator